MSDPADLAAPSGFLAAYARYRSPRIFLRVLAVVVFFWLTWNLLPFTPHFDDPGFERLNLFLSVESSVTVSILLAWQERIEATEKRRNLYVLETLEATRDMVEAQHAVILMLRDHLDRLEKRDAGEP